MAAVGLKIIEPVNDAAFTGSPTVTFRGALTAAPSTLEGTPIYYRWYSSLHPAEHEHYSMSPPLADADTAFSMVLGIGSHAITFAASDRSGETDADFEAMQHGGVTGGLEGDSRCIIHVFKANILAPLGGPVSRAAVTLEAEAPPAWAKSGNSDGLPPYVLDDDYHSYNRLRYRWCLEPSGGPAGRPTFEFIPAVATLEYDPDPLPARVKYAPSPPLPATATGNYRVVLYVEDAMEEAIGRHQADVLVQLT